MKAVIIHQYGDPSVLQWEDAPDPTPGPGQLLVQLAATSVNPVDFKRRSGAAKAMFPVEFPGILGVDVAGTVVALGEGVDNFAVGDRVIGMGNAAYATLCILDAKTAVKPPAGMDLIDAAAVPLVTLTGHDLITVGTQIGSGDSVLVTGAAGSVGRAAVLTAKEAGATVIAGVRQRQLADAATIGADKVIALDDPAAVAALPPVDAVADTVGGQTASGLLGNVKKAGVFASVVGPPPNADAFPDLRIVPVQVKPDAATLEHLARAVVTGALTLPISHRFPLSDAAAAQALAEQGAKGKVLLVADSSSVGGA